MMNAPGVGEVPVFIVAAFSDRPFRGNPAGVCVLHEAIGADTMQNIARELNQPETSFVEPFAEGWRIRWFSPTVEVALCGHATLAAAHVLWSQGFALLSAPIKFQASTRALEARSDSQGMTWLDFPVFPGIESAPPPDVLNAIDAQPLRAFQHDDRWLFEYATAAEVRAIKPKFPDLARTGTRSLIITAPSDMDGFDIVSRNFAPIVGVDEDQVTGVAHCCLAPHWQSRLGDELRCWQASGRGGSVITRLTKDRVNLGGQASLEVAGKFVI